MLNLRWFRNVAVGIARDKSIRSLRDLRARHLPLLQRMRDAGVRVALSRYGVAPSQLRVFVHYPPQFYHFHVHYTHVNVSIGVSTDRAHLLDDVMDNIKRDSEHYARASITCCVGETEIGEGRSPRSPELKKAPNVRRRRSVPPYSTGKTTPRWC